MIVIYTMHQQADLLPRLLMTRNGFYLNFIPTATTAIIRDMNMTTKDAPSITSNKHE